MIKYKLFCKDCNFSFDSWFASSQEYEKLEKKKYLICYNCNSKTVKKTFMAPKLINKSKIKKSNQENFKLKYIDKKMREYQKFIKNNFDYVGKSFAYEARSIHYGDNKKDKAIYGTASNNEIRELKEEGIDTVTIPWVENKKN